VTRLRRARVIPGPLRAAKADESSDTAPDGAKGTSAAARSRDIAAARWMPAEVTVAHEEAARIVAAARERADAWTAKVRADLYRELREKAHADADVAFAARAIALRSHEERHAERDLGRAMELAKLLAERIVGRELELAPDLITAMARQALTELRAARSAVIEAHPLDAEALARNIEASGLVDGAVELRQNPHLSRGSLRVQTNLGTLNAELAPQLDRLVLAIADLVPR